MTHEPLDLADTRARFAADYRASAERELNASRPIEWDDPESEQDVERQYAAYLQGEVRRIDAERAARFAWSNEAPDWDWRESEQVRSVEMCSPFDTECQQ